MKLKKLGANVTEVEMSSILTVLFSYQTPVAYKQYDGDGDFNVKVTDQYWSRTTTKHINKWVMGEKTQAVPQTQIDDLVEGVSL